MSVAKEQREKLIWEFPNIGKKAPEQEEKAFAYCEGYKEFLNAAKTEREFVREAVLRLKEAGYEDYDSLGGYIIELLDHLPSEGETAEDEHFLFKVGSVDKNRMETIHIIPKEQ